VTGAIHFATTDDGLRVPIVDVTNPAFAVTLDDDQLAELGRQYIRESTQQQEVPADVRAALARSRIGSGMMAARGGFLNGLTTYFLKLGPDNLTDDFAPIDRRIAASFPALTARLRLQDMARLLANGVSKALATDLQRPLHFVNIGGGPAADSWNALLALQHSGVPLSNHDVVVSVLDLDDRGPAFGASAIATLQQDGAPLHHLRIRFQGVAYNWSDAAQLGAVLDANDGNTALCVISSEGGLFEYGSDAEIAANLVALHEHTTADAIVVGSVCREGEMTRVHSGIGATLRPRRREAFAALATHSGWQVDTFIERPFSDSVRLVKR
jgi:hypothetical protein